LYFRDGVIIFLLKRGAMVGREEILNGAHQKGVLR
jgi:hypothetical protein